MEIEILELIIGHIKNGFKVSDLIRGMSLTEKEYLALSNAVNEKAAENMRKLSIDTEEQLSILLSYFRSPANIDTSYKKQIENGRD